MIEEKGYRLDGPTVDKNLRFLNFFPKKQNSILFGEEGLGPMARRHCFVVHPKSK